ncbi:hypothetical protein [Labrenzia sp. DG1229]|uniref:hypothetical protein n=1 Tax=Labrenzia sp. DG1229 TaxID=681847 RepID=UPI00048BA487|nr:hypothetical protein [Labrenzia sp. DG1229]
MTALRLFFVSLTTLILALVLANTLPAHYHHLAGAAILPLFVVMLISLNVAKKSLGRDRTSSADYGRTNRDAALGAQSPECGGADAG